MTWIFINLLTLNILVVWHATRIRILGESFSKVLESSLKYLETQRAHDEKIFKLISQLEESDERP